MEFRFGNVAAVEVVSDPHDPHATPERRPLEPLVPRESVFVPSPGLSVIDAVRQVVEPVRGFWDNVSDEPPSWVACSGGVKGQMAETLLAEHYGCLVGAPADVEQTHYTHNGPPGVDNSQNVVPEGVRQP